MARSRMRAVVFATLRLLSVAAPLVAGGCAPVVMAGGPNLAPPEMTQDHLIAGDGTALPLRIWSAEGGGEPKAVVVALHGFDDYSNQFAGPAAFWAKQGIATYAYDQRGFGAAPGHGYWPGTQTLIDDFAAALRAVRSRHPGAPVYALGASMGGAVVLAALARPDAPHPDGVVLEAPALWGGPTMNFFYRANLWLVAHLVPGLTLTGRGLGRRATDNDEVLRALARDPLAIKETRLDAIYGLEKLMGRAAASPPPSAPTLLLYGANDQIIPQTAIADYLEEFAATENAKLRFVYYPQGWHMLTRDLQAQTVWRDIARWIADPGGALPSGCEVAEDRAKSGAWAGR